MQWIIFHSTKKMINKKILRSLQIELQTFRETPCIKFNNFILQFLLQLEKQNLQRGILLKFQERAPLSQKYYFPSFYTLNIT